MKKILDWLHQPREIEIPVFMDWNNLRNYSLVIEYSWLSIVKWILVVILLIELIKLDIWLFEQVMKKRENDAFSRQNTLYIIE